MKKISDLTEASSIGYGNYLILETDDGTRKAKVGDILTNANGLAHNGIFRGKQLDTITASNIDTFLSNHGVSSGVFSDLYLGDYFTISDGTYNVQWMVAGFDTEYNKGNIAFTSHHVTLIPKTYVTKAQMNSTNTTGVSQNADNPVGSSAETANQRGGYLGSDMNQITIPAIVTALQTALGAHLLKHRCCLSNSINSSGSSMSGANLTGYSNGWEWTDQYATLMTEPQIYGTTIISSSFHDVGEGNQKLPVFNFINPTKYMYRSQWLRAIADLSSFACAISSGNAARDFASASHEVRPFICIG